MAGNAASPSINQMSPTCAEPESVWRASAMSDIMSILQSSYASAPLNSSGNAPYTNVNPQDYQGTWTGTYNNNQNFTLTVSQVQGFRAQVKYQSGTTVSYQSVLIRG